VALEMDLTGLGLSIDMQPYELYVQVICRLEGCTYLSGAGCVYGNFSRGRSVGPLHSM
jgi:hypothetical protein